MKSQIDADAQRAVDGVEGFEPAVLADQPVVAVLGGGEFEDQLVQALGLVVEGVVGRADPVKPSTT
ncbi:hypothetical protein [Streptosporangium sp. NPDC023615]|uniref:hypothetical protein n=1 Tax=Streptosporangium sp. NPDC023615 TaxID=3154794 RepID=UPI0034237FD8